MFGLQLKTFDRETAEGNPAAGAFIRSYLGMRMAIGLLGYFCRSCWWWLTRPSFTRQHPFAVP